MEIEYLQTITAENTEAIKRLTESQIKTTTNIDNLAKDMEELQKVLKTVVEDSPHIAVLESKVEFQGRVLWGAIAGVLGLLTKMILEHI